MKIDVKELFDTPRGKEIYCKARRAVKDFSMADKLRVGALVGFSGGADSVMLLCFLKRYYEENPGGKILAIHVNHMIRGAEACRDETFSRDFCSALGVEFISLKFDVIAEAKKLSKGIEETARDIRYSAFDDILQGRNDISCIAVAHNATDNLETAIFNMMRGSGSRGVAGILPVRDSIIRPLIYIPKRDITGVLDAASVPYVIDSTNAEIDYKRNYIRSEIIPKLHYLTENPEAQITKLSFALRTDDSYLEDEAEKFLNKFDGCVVPASELQRLHKALSARVIRSMAKKGGSSGCEFTHIAKISELLGKDFSIALPGGVSFISESGVCRVAKPMLEARPSYERKLQIGVNLIPEINCAVILSNEKIDNSFSKVYKISIQQIIDFDIISGELSVREKRDGDSYVYGKMRRKLKKIFNDRSIPQNVRSRIPIICDDAGILWVPGFPVRDGGDKNSKRKLFIAVAQIVNNN